MDAFFLSLREISVLVLPVLGAIVLIFLLFLFYQLYLMLKKVDILMDRVSKTMDIVDKELSDLHISISVLANLANGIVTIQNFTRSSVTTLALFLVEHFESIKQWIMGFFEPKDDVQTEEPIEEQNA